MIPTCYHHDDFEIDGNLTKTRPINVIEILEQELHFLRPQLYSTFVWNGYCSCNKSYRGYHLILRGPILSRNQNLTFKADVEIR